MTVLNQPAVMQWFFVAILCNPCVIWPKLNLCVLEVSILSKY